MSREAPRSRTLTLFLCGDVMTGRGIDQILPHPGAPQLFEPYVASALDYVRLAERRTGPIPRPTGFGHVWGDALAELTRLDVDARIVNLETAVTTSANASPDKSIHYRMHPANAPCLGAAALDVCTLANNHVLDWGDAGLAETLETLRAAGIRTAGAGRDARAAAAPAIVETGTGRVLVFAIGFASSGIPAAWAAGDSRPGVCFRERPSTRALTAVARRVHAAKRAGDVAVASLHWGGNWGFDIAPAERRFAHRLVEEAGIDVVHGHSSHHVKGIEVHRGRLILYGCGDFLNDYEGIGGYEPFRGELGLMFFPQLAVPSGRLLRLAMKPSRIRHFRIERAPPEGTRWLCEVLSREGRRLGSRVERQADDTLLLRWEEAEE